VQEHSLVGLREVQDVARLLGRVALDVAKHDHIALARRQIGDRRQQPIAQFVVLDPRFDSLPFRWRPRPPAGALTIAALEAIRVDGRFIAALLGAPAQRRERQRALFPLPLRPGDVEEDLEDPGAQRGAWTASSAIARLGTCASAKRMRAGLSSSTRLANAW